MYPILFEKNLQKIKNFDAIYANDVISENSININNYDDFFKNHKDLNLSNHRISLSYYDLQTAERKNLIAQDKNLQELINFLTSKIFFSLVIEKFKLEISNKYPKIINDIKKARIGIRKINSFKEYDFLLDAQLCINTPVKVPTQVRLPHLDAQNKLFFGLLYLRDPKDNSVGGELLIEEPKSKDTKYHIAPDKNYYHETNILKKIPYEQGNAIILLNSKDALHGVSPRSITNINRRFINIVCEYKKDLFEIPRTFLPWVQPEKKIYSPISILGFDNSKNNLLVINPESVSNQFHDLNSKFNIFFENDLNNKKINFHFILIGKGREKLTEVIFNKISINGNTKIFIFGQNEKFIDKNLLENFESKQLINIDKYYAQYLADYSITLIRLNERNILDAYKKFNLQKTWRPFVIESLYSNLQKSLKKSRKIKSFFLKVLYLLLIKFKYKYLFSKYKNLNTSKYGFFLGNSTWGKKLIKNSRILIVGYGNVGREIKKKMSPLCDELFVFTNYAEKNTPNFITNLDELKKNEKFDVIIICVKYKSTKVSYEILSHLNQNGTLINISRAKYIDINDILKLLKEQFTVISDVGYSEPIGRDDKLLMKYDNYFYLPHIGVNNQDLYQEALKNLINEIKTSS
jgi:phosphoglycerate dehydrogenase-like enzyme